MQDTGGESDGISSAQAVTGADAGRFKQDVPADGHQLEIRETVEKDLVLVRDILPAELQRTHGEFEKRQFRYDALEPPVLDGLHDTPGSGCEGGMRLEVIDPDAGVDQDPAMAAQRRKVHQSFRSSRR